MNMHAKSQATPIPCPCCGRPISVPTIELLIDRYRLASREEKILRAVWRGRGFPVMTDRIFDVMYEDDPDGGPTWSNMYNSFKSGLHKLRLKIDGSGISIQNVGKGQGYRLVIGE